MVLGNWWRRAAHPLRYARLNARSPQPARFHPRLEVLEDRTLLNAYSVTNTLDNGSGSLRQAILDANANLGADTINITATGTITLAAELDVTEAVSIYGPGAASLTVSGNNAHRIYNISSSATFVEIYNVTLANGFTSASDPHPGQGGAIYNAGTLYVTNVVFTANVAKGLTGGDGTDTGNQSPHAGGGGGGGGAFGGAIYNAPGATLTVTQSTFTDNKAVGGNGGQSAPPRASVFQATGGTGANSGGAGGGFTGSAGLTGASGVAFGSGGGGGGAASLSGGPGGAGAFGGGGGGGGARTSGGTGGLGGGSIAGGGTGGQGMFSGGGAGGGGAGMGGAIFNNGGTAYIATSLFSGNDASGGSGGNANNSGFGDGFAGQGIDDDFGFNGGTNYFLVVLNTGDGTNGTIAANGFSEAGTLRQAILDANAHPGTDTVTFDIPGAGVHTISPTSALPGIDEAVRIDGYTQPGSSVNTLSVGDNAVLTIELNGSGSGAGVDGLTVAAPNSVIRGLVINGFSNNGIMVGAAAAGSTISGNFIGTDTTGTAGPGNGLHGIQLFSAGDLIGGTAAADRNIISGNGYHGVAVNANGSQIVNNYIGTDKNGTGKLANTVAGIGLNAATNTTIGGLTSAARNVISGNDQSGIELFGGSSGNVVEGNYIGTDASGTAAQGNGAYGVYTFVGSTGNTIGGTAAGAGNVISGNTQAGVVVANSSATGNAILGNSIVGNGGLGIDLNADGMTPNDPDDPDPGPNNLQNFPVLQYAVNNGTTTTVAGTLNSIANTMFHVEFFANLTQDATTFGEGQTYLGFLDVMTDGSGNVSFTANNLLPVPVGQFVSATATDLGGNTSEFSGNVLTTGPTTQLLVTTALTYTAGFAQAVTIKAADAQGNVTPGFVGLVSFASSDLLAGLTAAHAFTLADHGVFIFNATLNTPGLQSITATTPGLMDGGQTNIAVNPPPAGLRYVVNTGNVTTIQAGQVLHFSVTLDDGFGSYPFNFETTATFTTSDLQAVPSGPLLFHFSDATPTWDFDVTFKTVNPQGGQAITIQDGFGIRTFVAIQVTPAPAEDFTLDMPTVTPNVAGTLTVTARDAYGNVDTNYVGTVTITNPSGPPATLPAPHTFIATDRGVHGYHVTTLQESNLYSFTATGPDPNDPVHATITGSLNNIVSILPSGMLGGAEGVITGTTYYLTITDINPGTATLTWTIDWGDSVTVRDTQQVTTNAANPVVVVEHVYTTTGFSPYGCIILTATATVENNPGVTLIPAPSFLDVDLVPVGAAFFACDTNIDDTRVVQLNVAVPTVQATVSVAAGQVSIAFAATFAGNPVGVPIAGGAVFSDFMVAGPAQTATAVFHFPPGSKAPVLYYFDTSDPLNLKWVQVQGSQDPALVDHSYVVDAAAGTITVILDDTSNPKIGELLGTVFTVTIVQPNREVVPVVPPQAVVSTLAAPPSSSPPVVASGFVTSSTLTLTLSPTITTSDSGGGGDAAVNVDVEALAKEISQYLSIVWAGFTGVYHLMLAPLPVSPPAVNPPGNDGAAGLDLLEHDPFAVELGGPLQDAFVGGHVVSPAATGDQAISPGAAGTSGRTPEDMPVGALWTQVFADDWLPADGPVTADRGTSEAPASWSESGSLGGLRCAVLIDEVQAARHHLDDSRLSAGDLAAAALTLGWSAWCAAVEQPRRRRDDRRERRGSVR